MLYAGRVVLLEDRSLKLLNVTLDDMGEYTCEADNEVGSIMATGVLTVHGEFSDNSKTRKRKTNPFFDKIKLSII